MKKYLTLILIYAVVLLSAACPKVEKTFRTASEQSAKMKIYGIELINANIELKRNGTISAAELRSLNVYTGGFVAGVKIYQQALDEAEKIIKSGQPLPAGTLAKLSVIFSDNVIDAFFGILNGLKIFPNANSLAVRAILSSIRLAILATQNALGESFNVQRMNEVSI